MRSVFLEGNIDGFIEHRLHGWAFDPSDPAEPVEVLVMIDGVVAGTVRADRFREDLSAAGKGTGHCGFVFRVPAPLLDDQPHSFDVLAVAQKAPLPGSPAELVLPARAAPLDGAIDGISGVNLTGWVRLDADADEAQELLLCESGAPLTSFVAGHPRDDGTRAFSVRLPRAICDGESHVLTVETDRLIAASAVITPFLITPPEILGDLGQGRWTGQLSRSAGHRLAALSDQIEATRDLSPKKAQEAVADFSACVQVLERRPGATDNVPLFSFPKQREPRATVVIPVHNQIDFTLRCLASLRLMPGRTPFTVLVLDDDSSDGTIELEELVKGIRIIRRQQACGFLRNCNIGAQKVTSEYIVLLNNDTEVTPYWLDHLLTPFSDFEDVGLVGAKLLFGDGRLQEAGGLVWRDGSIWNYGRGQNPRDPRYNFLRETDYCSAACAALPTALWRQLDGFDDAYAPAYFEDTDLAFRVRAAGKRVIYQPLSEVVHFEGVSHGTDDEGGGKRHQKANFPRFASRWGNAFRSHGMPGAAPHLAQERSYAGRVLVLDTEVPQANRSAGHYAAIQELRMLQALGYRPTFFPMNHAHLGSYNDVLSSLGVESIHAPFYLSLEEFLRERGGDFDLVYITRYHVARAALDLIRVRCPRAKVVFNNADLHFLRMLREASLDDSDAQREEASAVRDDELAVIRAVDLALCYTDVERAVILSHDLGYSRVARCPWIVEPKAETRTFEERNGIGFLGGFRHRPNERAVVAFVRDVFPLLRSSRPELAFHIFGSAPTDAVLALGEVDGVHVHGFVEDLGDVFDRMRVFVAPLQTGAGIKGKVLDALAHGVPSVLSEIAAEGIGIRDGGEACIARTPDEWCSAILSLHDDRAAWGATSVAAKAFVETHHSFERGVELMRDAFASVGIATPQGLVARQWRANGSPAP